MNKKRMIRFILLVIVLGILAAGAYWLLCYSQMPRPNVLIVTMDTTRADRLSCYGYDRIKTPRIDAVAQEGVLFEEAFSDQPVTLPSHSSIFTGKHPFHHGVRDNNIYRLSEENLTLAEMLAAEGYVTGAFVSSYILDHQFGLNQGFQRFNDRFLKPKQKGRLPVDRRAVEVSILASQWLETNKKALQKKPFFLWLHYYDPHADYDPPPPYNEAYPGSPYDGEIAYMDDWIGYVFDTLKRLGWWDNTMVILVGDHGESLGEFGEETHGVFIYRPTTHVPLIVRYPAALPGGLRIKERVATVDIVPTLLDLLTIETNESFDGRSLIPLMHGEKKGYPRIIYSEAFIPRSFNWSEIKGIRQGDQFYIEAPEPELYKIEAGKKEEENIITQIPAQAEAMKNVLYELLSGEEPAQTEQVAVTADMIERLKALGYFVGGGQGEHEEEPGSGLPDPKERIQLFTLYQRANTAARNEHYKSATRLFEKIIEQDPDNPRFLMEFGDILIDSKEFETAEKYLKHASASSAKDPRPHYLLGRCYQAWGKAGMALDSYHDALELNPDHFMAHFQTGLIHIEAHAWDQAEQSFREAKRIRPRDATTLNNLGYIAIKGRGEFEAGIDLIQQALRLAPQNPDLLASLGWAHYNKGDFENAATHLENALALVPDSPTFISQLKAVYESSGDEGKLEKLLKREQILKTEMMLGG